MWAVSGPLGSLRAGFWYTSEKERRGKEERGGEEREKEKELTWIMKVKVLYKNRKIRKKQERESGSKGGKEGGKEGQECPTPQNPTDRVTTVSTQVPGLLLVFRPHAYQCIFLKVQSSCK